MNKRPKKREKNRTFFHPDAISTRIAEELIRDLDHAALEYGVRSDMVAVYKSIQEKAVLKKYCSPDNKDDVRSTKAYEKFVAVNQHMASFKEDTGLNIPSSMKPDLDVRANILRSARLLCSSILTPIHGVALEDDEWFYHCKHSNGVSQGVGYSNTEVEGKSTYPMTGTDRVKPLVHQYALYDKRFVEALEAFNLQKGYSGPAYDVSVESRATTVPKTTDIDRMIAIEPTWNMFFQQGLMAVMFDRLRKSGLDVVVLPDRHRDLAFEGSITGSLATVDFESASDCLSYDLLKWLLPAEWFRRLDRVRSSKMRLPGVSVELNMFSTMGNADTFPLETLVFYSLACATVHHLNLKPGHKLGLLVTPEEREQCSVFGDDCIVPTFAADQFIKVCESVGFKVNKEKSFIDPEPGFRESCGGDFLRGMDMRPFSIKAPTSTALSCLEPWLYIIYNQVLPVLKKTRGRRNYLYGSNTLGLLGQICEKHKIHVKIVPKHFPDDAGLKIADDYQRFQACYPSIRFSKIGVSSQGWLDLRYCRFNYRSTQEKSPDLRYNVKLKDLEKSLRQHSIEAVLNERFKVRKNGGYVVAKALIPSWNCVD